MFLGLGSPEHIPRHRRNILSVGTGIPATLPGDLRVSVKLSVIPKADEAADEAVG